MRFSKTNTQKALCGLVFVLFFAFLLAQFWQVGVYYDDYAYYSLPYSKSYQHQGNTFTLPELLRFLDAHYRNVNGRIAYFVVWLLSYMIGGLTMVRFLAAAVVTAVAWLLWRVANRSLPEHPVITAFVICFSYGLLEITLHRSGTYWMAAFFLYVMPLVPFLLFCLWYFPRRAALQEQRKGHKLAACLLLGYAAMAQEAFGVAVVAFAGMLIVLAMMEKKFCWFHGSCLAFAAAGCAVLLQNPGIRSRAASNTAFAALSLSEKIVGNTRSLVAMFYAAEMRCFQTALFAALAAVGLCLVLRDKNKLFFVADLAFVMASLGGVAVFVWTPSWFARLAARPAGLILLVCWLCIFILQVTRFYLQCNRVCELLIFYTSVISIACLVVVPELPWRLFLPLCLLCFLLMAEAFGTVLALSDQRYTGVFAVLIVVLFALPSVKNSVSIYRGYSQNAVVLRHNDAMLRDASEAVKKGEPVDTIFLQTLPDILYAGEMVYSEGFEFMKKWMDNYYELPHQIVYRFTKTGEPQGPNLETANILEGYWEDGWVTTKSRFQIKTGEAGEMRITGTVPQQQNGTEQITILFDGEEVAQYKVTEQEFHLVIDCPKNAELEVTLETNFSFVKQPDDRVLSFILNEIDTE